MAQLVNLVLQGGGVKGIALVGALHALENNPPLRDEIIVNGVGGVSVGALVAALYAAGYSAKELAAELDRKPISSLIDHPPRTWIGMARRLSSQKGLYSTRAIYTWVKDLLEERNVKTFNDLKKPCRILAANVTGNSYDIYSEGDVHEEVASAVLKSLSIPIFFTPYVDGESLFVDGGMLSNYPLWLFKESKLPTVGLKLVGKPRGGPGPESKLLQYVMGLLDTMLNAHDQLGLGNPPNATEIPINVSEVDSTDFHVEDIQRKLLFERGAAAVGRFDWSTLPPPRVTVFDDRHAAQVLEETANNVEKLLDRTKSANQRSFDYFHFSYSVRENGAGDDERHFLLRNHGPGPISWVRQSHQYDYEVDVSFMDLRLTVECKPLGKEVVVEPTSNTNLEKAFGLAFIPPILPGEYREVKVNAHLPRFFKRFVDHQKEELRVEVAHEAGINQASLTLHVAPKFTRIEISRDSGGTTPLNSDPSQPSPGSYVWTFGSIEPGEDLDFKVYFRQI